MHNKSDIKLQKIEQPDTAPVEYRLDQNLPNPFKEETGIGFSIHQRGPVKLVVCNLHEEPVCVLHNGPLEPGEYEIYWDGTTSDGQRLQNGSYEYNLEAKGFFASRRLIIKER